LDIDQYDNLILVPALKVANLYSLSAHVIMLGTILHESHLNYVEQVGGGPALGFSQIESKTHADIQRYLNRYDNKALKERVLSACFYECFPSDDALIHNLRYSVLITRIKYYMIPAILPEPNDFESMAKYYIKYYNAGGKAKQDDTERLFKSLISDRFKG
jgi:hypothetical protein